MARWGEGAVGSDRGESDIEGRDTGRLRELLPTHTPGRSGSLISIAGICLVRSLCACLCVTVCASARVA